MNLFRSIVIAIMMNVCFSLTTVDILKDSCDCVQISYQPDCQSHRIIQNGKLLQCQWTQQLNQTNSEPKGKCTTLTRRNLQVQPQKTYCSQITISDCSKMNGCTLIDNTTCIPFAGCSAYIAITNAACQSMSSKCTTDGSQCTVKSPCSAYGFQLCGANSSSSGSGECKWVGQACVDYQCLDMFSQEQCLSYNSGCSWDGSQCARQLLPCLQILGTETTCSSQSGSDGPCKYVSGPNCEQVICSDAPTSLNTNKLCQAFLASCPFTTGLGCVAQLYPCANYQQSSTCSQLIGSDGLCKQSGVQCAAQSCTDIIYPQASYKVCKSIAGCYFNGIICVTVLPSCDSYTNGIAKQCPDFPGYDVTDGIVANCLGYIGWEGPCTFVGDQMVVGSRCGRRLCSHILLGPVYLNSYCQSYHPLCRSNVTGCYQPTGLCETSDGCKSANQGCYFNGMVCVSQVVPSLDACRQQNSCKQSKEGCFFDGAHCQTSLSTCTAFENGQEGVVCFDRVGGEGKCTYGSTTQCVVRRCDDHLGAARKTNEVCQGYQSTCVTNGQICYLPTDSCEDTQQEIACEGQSKCTVLGFCYDNTDCGNYLTISSCIWNTAGRFDRSCSWVGGVCSSQNLCGLLKGATFTTNAGCSASLNGCVTDGQPTGNCIEPDEGCAAYWGTNQSGSLCLQVMNGLCYGLDTSFQRCTVRKCWHLLNPIGTPSTDVQCSLHLSGCVSDGNLSCITATTCSGYHGSAASCIAITSNTDMGPMARKQCWPIFENQASGACRIMTCSDILIGQLPYAVVQSSECSSRNPNCISSYNAGKGMQCVEIINCASIQGLDSICRQYFINNEQCFQPSSNANSNSPCIAISCAINTTATSDKQCEKHWPSPPGSIPNYNCQWSGKLGCVKGQTLSCKDFVGDKITCPQFIAAIDSPCKVNPLINYGHKDCVTTVCADAPTSYTTNAQCSLFRKGCMTTGHGCQAKIEINSCQQLQSEALCNSSSFGTAPSQTCTWKKLCMNKLLFCSEINVLTYYGRQQQSLCTNTKVQKTTSNPLGTCSWSYGLCRDTECADLPKNISTDQACSIMIPNCTTNGTGCILRGPCSSYLDPVTCLSAATTDPVSCTWIPTIGCKISKCTDNQFNSDEDCQIPGLNCRTNGLTCLDASKLLCSHLTNMNNCISDGADNPCLWINNGCFQYNGCTSIPWITHFQCQMIVTGTSIPLCTSDGLTCQPLNSCDKYQSKISCVISNEGSLCEFQDKLNLCQSACSTVKNPSNSVCHSFSPKCIFNGTTCQLQSSCSSYSQIGCQNIGFDGQCIWSSNLGICRTQQCTDALLNTYADCASFRAPFANMCTTNGSKCISISMCQAYSLQISCIQGTDGACLWINSNSLCILKQSMACAQYTQTGCYNQGTDGQCIWSVQTNTCTPQQCEDAVSNNKTFAWCFAFPGPYPNKCTTNGISCLPIAKCSEYSLQISCVQGLEGACLWVMSEQANQGICITKQSMNCALYNQNGCNNMGTDGTCIWSRQSNSCRTQQCSDVNLKTLAECLAFPAPYPNMCTTNGSGCINKGTCSSYISQASCIQGTDGSCSWTNPISPSANGICSSVQKLLAQAVSNCASQNLVNCSNLGTDGTCIWSSQTQTCRVQQCSDAVMNTTSDTGCAIFPGPFINLCTTNGSSCIPRSTCASYLIQASCVQGTDGICQWNNPVPPSTQGSCSNKQQVTQLNCSQYNQPSCKTGTDGPCTWSTTMNSCKITECQDALINNTTDSGCAAFPAPQVNRCTTNGKSCITKFTCSSYTQQSACFQGTDGVCFWSNGNCSNIQPIILLNCVQYSQQACTGNRGFDGACIWGTTGCRAQECADSVTDNKTDSGCAAFQGPYQNFCTSNGNSCIRRQVCSSYTQQLSCLFGLDGDCFWVSSSGTCRLKQCIDLMLTTNTACMSAQIASQARGVSGTAAKYLQCVSNGTNCIPQAICQSYTNPVSCAGYNSGTDGTCGFTATSSPNTGSCKLVSSCTDIGTDAATCQQFSDRCQFKSIQLTNTTSAFCVANECGSQIGTCLPIPSFNQTSYTICAPVSAANSTCQNSDGSQLNERNCFSGSAGTYSWDDQKKECIYCRTPVTVPNDPILSGLVLHWMFLMVILFMGN